LPVDGRRAVGEAFNQVKTRIEDEVGRSLGEGGSRGLRADLVRSVDVTLPGRAIPPGHLHLVTQTRRELVAVLAELGFEVAEGPQIDTDFHCFEALALPKDHPA